MSCDAVISTAKTLRCKLIQIMCNSRQVCSFLLDKGLKEPLDGNGTITVPSQTKTGI